MVVGAFPHLDHKLADIHCSENLVDNIDTLGVGDNCGDHCVVFSHNVKVTPVELPKVVFALNSI